MDSRSVIWITVESLRQNHTFSLFSSEQITPNLNRMAQTGVEFSQCHAHSIWTRPSTASILTGHPPSAHQTWSNDAKLPENLLTIPEAFATAGYRTVGISPIAQFSPATGLDNGFNQFQYINKSTILHEAGIPTLFRWVKNIYNHSGGLTRDSRQHCTSYFINQLAKRQIHESGEQPLFLYLHYGDTHHPYIPPVAWRRRFIDDLSMSAQEAVDLALDMSEHLIEKTAADDPFSEDEWKTLKVLYNASIAYVDHMIGELLSFVEDHLTDPIIVITGDHGEILGERGLLEHALITSEVTTNVPLIIKNIEGLSGSGIIQHADVMEMISNTLGVDHPVPAGMDIRETPRQYAVTQRAGKRTRWKLDEIQQHNEDFPVDQFHHGDLTSIRTTDWRYQRSADGHDLFRLPDETTDVSEEYPEKVAEFEARYDSWMSEIGAPAGTAQTAQFTAGMKEQLRDLGYL